VIRAAGAVLWREGAQGTEIAVVHRPDYDDWTLPKGKPARGEHPLVAACWEVWEETGMRASAGQRLPSVSYSVDDEPKTVEYWAMHADGGSFVPTQEVDRIVWLPALKARLRLSHPAEAKVVDAFVQASFGSLVLLVRHGAAGDPGTWEGEDRERPLDAEGRRQAEALRRVLPCFGPVRVLSAEPVRCRDTVASLAASLGLDVRVEPVFGEKGHAADPDGAVRRVRELAARGGTSVVCSQGTVIRDVVAGLTAGTGEGLVDFRPRKGSVSALSFRGLRLLAVDYYPEFEFGDAPV
jgi:broad specificity phosphatase PhoE/predicted NUDIX family NTP pyrophosphohydrolase